MLAAIFVTTLFYAMGGVAAYTCPAFDEYEDHHKVVIGLVWPVVLAYYLIKYTYILIKYIIVSIYKTILDIPIFSKIKEGINERSLTPLNEVSGRVINNIKERTQPW